MKQTNMYTDAKSWNPFRGCGFDCHYCRKSFQAQAKRQKQICQACYDYTPHEHPERLDRLPSVPSGGFIFACSSGDIAFCRTGYLEQIVAVARTVSGKTFLFQSKAPATFKRVVFPGNVLLGVTLETNRDDSAGAVSRAPVPSVRVADFVEVVHSRKSVTIEPILDFDLEEMVGMVRQIGPEQIWIGYDSKKCGLVAPEQDKFWALVSVLEKDYPVKLKTVRQE